MSWAVPAWVPLLWHDVTTQVNHWVIPTLGCSALPTILHPVCHSLYGGSRWSEVSEALKIQTKDPNEIGTFTAFIWQSPNCKGTATHGFKFHYLHPLELTGLPHMYYQGFRVRIEIQDLEGCHLGTDMRPDSFRALELDFCFPALIGTARNPGCHFLLIQNSSTCWKLRKVCWLRIRSLECYCSLTHRMKGLDWLLKPTDESPKILDVVACFSKSYECRTSVPAAVWAILMSNQWVMSLPVPQHFSEIIDSIVSGQLNLF